LDFNQKALEIFSNFNKPFGVLSIIGAKNTGKSCFMNRLISSRAKGFALSSHKSNNPPVFIQKINSFFIFIFI